MANMRPVHILRILLWFGLLAFGGILLWGYARSHPEDLPWTELDLAQPIGAFTGRKLTGTGGEQCRLLLARAGIRFNALPPRSASEQCGYDDAVRFRPGGAVRIAFAPRDVGTRCPVAAALALWEWHVVQPAAIKHLGSQVATIDHLGSYSCRRMYNRPDAGWSEHATANALDIAGFRLSDGTRISVLDHWDEAGPRGAFLRDVRDGACGLFATVLSPDYNAAHRDHLHLDQAERGEMGWRACR